MPTPFLTWSDVRRILAITCGTLALAFGVYHFVTGPSKARKEAAVSQATATTADAGMKSAQDALKIIVDTQAVTGRIDVVTQGNRNAILAAPSASEALGTDLHDAGIRALCLRGTYRLQPACERLLDPDPVQSSR